MSVLMSPTSVPKLRGVSDDVRHARAPQLVLGRHAGDRGARAADPAALDHGDLLAGLGEAPREQLSALAAAENDDVEMFRLRHVPLH